MSTSQDDNKVDNDEGREPNVADAQALAKAGANAAAEATPGTSPEQLKKMIREAVKEEADERGLRGFGDAEAQMIAGSVIMALERRGAFAQPEETANPVDTLTDDNTDGSQPQPPAPSEDAQPHKTTFAEKYLRGGR